MEWIKIAVTAGICLMIHDPALSQWKKLFDGSTLNGWDTYLGPGYDTLKNEWNMEVKGLNNDPRKVFSVVELEGQHVIRVSGENFGGLSTRDEYSNYHLRMEFKWGKLKFPPRKNSKRDSGVLYHAGGKHGADFGFWMRSQEFQVQEGDCGDYWGVAGGSFQIKASGKGPEKYVYDPGGPLLTFNEKSPHGRRCIKNPDAEKPYGEWNTIEIVCFKDTAVHIINGVVVMVLTSSGQLENETIKPLTSGKIQIQSEGAEIFYRNIGLKPVTSIPEGVF